MMNMKLLEAELPVGWTWQRVSDKFRVTKKPRDLVLASFDAISFVPMEAVPVNGHERVSYELRAPSQIASGTYFEKGDVLLSKITPSFENGKQGLANNIPGDFGVASTEIIPLQRLDGETNSRFLFYYLLHPEVRATLAGKMEGSTGRQRVPEHAVRDFPFPVAPRSEQEKIATVLLKVQRTIEVEEKLIATAREMKQSAMRQLFSHGIRREPQKDSEIGRIPESWIVRRLDDCCDVVSSSLSYTDFSMMPETNADDAVIAMGIKVSDMNLTGNGNRIARANLQKHVPASLATKKLVPPNTVVFPKRGAAIATNKKRMTTAWTVLDPNVIGVRAGDRVNEEFLFYWFQTFDLRTITEAGPTPQLNKKNLDPLLLPIPATEDEQREIAALLQKIDSKIDIHEGKFGALQDLFKTLLHKLMTGEIRIADLDIDTDEVAIQ